MWFNPPALLFMSSCLRELGEGIKAGRFHWQVRACNNHMWSSPVSQSLTDTPHLQGPGSSAGLGFSPSTCGRQVPGDWVDTVAWACEHLELLAHGCGSSPPKVGVLSRYIATP
jgi:hypothetical protein